MKEYSSDRLRLIEEAKADLLKSRVEPEEVEFLLRWYDKELPDEVKRVLYRLVVYLEKEEALQALKESGNR